MPAFKAWISFALVPAMFAQQAQPPKDELRFKIQSSTVVVDAIVTDGKGNPVTNLTAADFQVFENGVAQKVLSFEPPSPAEAAKGTASGAPSTVVNPPGIGPSRSLRLITLVLDVSDMRGQSLKTSIEAAHKYVDRAIGGEDYVAVYAIGTDLQLIVPYTQDKKKIDAGLESLARSNRAIQSASSRDSSVSQMNALADQVNSLKNAGDAASAALAKMAEVERLTIEVEMAFQATMQTRVLFRALRSIATAAGTLPGRKNVVLFSEGLPETLETRSGISSVVDAANRANVAFYVIDPSGLANISLMGNFDAGAATNGRAGSNTQAGRDLADSRRGTDVVAGETKFDKLFRMSADGDRDGLRVVADQTGGLLIKNQNELKASLDRIDKDLREFYTLTYQPQDSTFDGSFRAIKLNVAGKGLHVRYRKGYYALAPGEEMKLTPAAAQVLAALAGGSLKASVKPAINAAAVFNSPTDIAVPVSIWLPGQTTWVSKNDKGYNAGMTIVVTARTADGHLAGVFQKFADAKFTKDEWKAIEKKGLQVVANMTIPKLEPLSIEAVLQFSNGEVGIGTAKLALAGTEESARLTSVFVTPRVDVTKAVRDGDPPALHIATYQLALPTSQQFAPSDKLTIYIGMDNVTMDAASGNPKINLSLALKSGDKVIKDLPAVSMYPFPESKNRIFFLDQLDLAGLAPGKYSLQATLKDLTTKASSANSTELIIQ